MGHRCSIPVCQPAPWVLEAQSAPEALLGLVALEDRQDLEVPEVQQVLEYPEALEDPEVLVGRHSSHRSL